MVSSVAEETLYEKIHHEINTSIEANIGVKAEHISAHLGSEVMDPVLTLRIFDELSGTTTTIKVPVGLANVDKGVYFARINAKLEEYRSPEDIGAKAAETFRRQYTTDVMGI